jgi:hypothetical protein
MKRILLVAAVPAAALFGAVALAAPAMASSGPNGNGQTALLTGRDAAVYTDGVFGPVKCNETQHPKFDTVECQFTAGQVFTPGLTGTGSWSSDFGDRANIGVITFTVNQDGTGYSGHATYPNG